MIFKNHALLSDYTTFQLGGPCPSLSDCTTPDELIAAIQQFKKEGTRFILIGGGSNIVFADEGLKLAVIRYMSLSPLIEQHGHQLTVQACTLLDDLALYCTQEGLEGLNFTSGIPGTVGGAVVGNAGAWGQQVGDALLSAKLVDHLGQTKIVGPDYFAFSYRHSRLKETEEIIITVTFTLKPGDPVKLAHERADILKKRAEKHPSLSTHPCAGSFFRNIEPTSKAEHRQASGWFLEKAGAKSMKCGGAYVYDKHANIIIKGPGAKSQDVYDLHLRMKSAVKKEFGLDLAREVRFAGKFHNVQELTPEGFW